MFYTLIVFHCMCLKINEKLTQILISYLNVFITLRIHIQVYSPFMPNSKMLRAGYKWDLLPLLIWLLHHISLLVKHRDIPFCEALGTIFVIIQQNGLLIFWQISFTCTFQTLIPFSNQWIFTGWPSSAHAQSATMN